jgi:hypothetical protein
MREGVLCRGMLLISVEALGLERCGAGGRKAIGVSGVCDMMCFNVEFIRWVTGWVG